MGLFKTMSLPNVLIIGAMKSGTTGLYMDLSSHPQVFRGENKETHALCDDEILTESGAAAYSEHYARARPDQLIVDASTDYSKRPDFEKVADRAVKLLPADFKVIYIVRDPIERIISHHHHEYTAGNAGRNIDEEVRRLPCFIDYSRYAYQLEPWLEAIGMQRIHVIRFEDYVHCRTRVLEELCRFLRLDHNLLVLNQDKVYNKSARKPVRNRFWDVVFHSAAYRRIIRRTLSPSLRLTLMQWLLPRGSLRPDDPNPETIQWLRVQLADDVAKLQALLKSERPLWEGFETPDSTAAPRELSGSRGYL